MPQFDTFTFARNLRANGHFTPDQADVLAQNISDAIEEVMESRRSRRLTTRSAPQSIRSKTTASLLAIFLGGFGAHQFYLGRSLVGLIYLLLCWTFVPAILGLIQGLNYLSMSDVQFADKFNH